MDKAMDDKFVFTSTIMINKNYCLKIFKKPKPTNDKSFGVSIIYSPISPPSPGNDPFSRWAPNGFPILALVS